jgi:hypothetical protein
VRDTQLPCIFFFRQSITQKRKEKKVDGKQQANWNEYADACMMLIKIELCVSDVSQ